MRFSMYVMLGLGRRYQIRVVLEKVLSERALTQYKALSDYVFPPSGVDVGVSGVGLDKLFARSHLLAHEH